jgi:4-hydroxy-3-methylbut-2-enyl diphosphate reductase
MSGPVICAPLRVEARALRRGLRGAGPDTPAAVTVLRTGYGPARSAEAAARLGRAGAGLMAVGGVAGALVDDLSIGDLVVASKVTGGGLAVTCPSAPLLAGELRRAGLRTRVGPIATVDRLLGRSELAALAAAGAIAVDMESAPLLGGSDGRPSVVVRAISDTPEHSLLSHRTVTGGLAALRSLRQAGPVLARWAAAVGTRKVLMASPRSFCAGVERAIEIVELALERYGAPVYVRMASRPRFGVRRTGAAWPPWTPLARWSPRCTPRRAGSPLTATWWLSSDTPATRKSKARWARRRRRRRWWRTLPMSPG